MTSWQSIAEALGGALAVCWGFYVEFRLRQAQADNTKLQRAFNDQAIQDSVNSESSATTLNKLSAEVKG